MGRLFPNISPALIEFGYPIEDLAVRIHRPYGNGIQGQRRQWPTFVAKHWEARIDRGPENRVKLAMVYFAESQWERAEHWIREARLVALSDPWMLQVEFLEASIAAQLEHYEAAAAHLEVSLRNHPYSTDLLFLNATVLANLGRHDEAYLGFIEALARGEEYAAYSEPGVGSYLCRRWLARVEAARQRYKEAVREYLSLLEQYPYYRAAWVELLDLLRGAEPEEIVELLTFVLSKRQILEYLDRQTQLSPVEVEVKNWLQPE
jgi:tetratricopeptide (TPR) repeat protein